MHRFVETRRGRVHFHSHAWTLLELLVVISIIALLTGLILPGLGRAKARSKTVVCLNNLRQWALGQQLYAGDNEDYLVPEGDPSPDRGVLRNGWYVLLPRQLGLEPPYDSQPWRTNPAAAVSSSSWICPSNTNRSNGLNLFHYCLNQHADGSGELDRPIRLGGVANPSVVVWMFDNGRRAAVAQQNNVHPNLHQSGANFAFLDGHVNRFSNRDYWDFSKQSGRTNHPGLVWRHLD